MPDTPVKFLLSNTHAFDDCPVCWQRFILSLGIPLSVNRHERRDKIQNELAKYGGRFILNDQDELTHVEFESQPHLAEWLLMYS